MKNLVLAEASQLAWSSFYSSVKQGNRFELASVITPNSLIPIYLRQGTSDVDNFMQIFGRDEYNFLSIYPRSIIDLGGYIGLASIYLARKFPEARITLVEPDPDNYSMALLNCRAYPQIHCLQAGVWSKKCELEISAKVGGDWGTMVRERPIKSNSMHSSIPALTVADIMNLSDFSRVDFVKIDIEGSELELFVSDSFESWIDKCNVISCELHDRMVAGCSSAFYAAFKGRPFVHGKSGEYDYFIRESLLGIADLHVLKSQYVLF